MENTQNDPNMQAQTEQAAAQEMQTKLLLDIVQKTGLDANNPAHQKMAAEVLNNVFELQDPAREKERNGIMREYGLQPDEFKAAIEGVIAQSDQLNQKLEEMGNKATDLAENKLKKSTMISTVIGVVVGAIATYGVHAKWLKGLDKGWKKWGGGIATMVATSLAGGAIADQFTSKPIKKEIEGIAVQGEELSIKNQQLIVQAQELQYNMIRDLSAGMLKTRAEAAAKPPAPVAPIVSVPTKPVAAAQRPHPQEEKRNTLQKMTDTVGITAPEGKESALDKVLDTVGAKAPIDKILGNAPAASNVEKVEEDKLKAASATTLLGG
ncbi:MAG: hypothetical protein P8P30_06035 [Rickettsiales bacterium]|nr:hypothetical protein [Rickettsiales bacterium]